MPTKRFVSSKIRNVNVAGRSAGGGFPNGGRPCCGLLQTIRLGIGSKQVHPRLVRSAGVRWLADA